MVSKRGDETEVLKYLTLLMILFAAAWTDLCTEKISNRLIFFGIGIGLFFQLKEHGAVGILYFFIYISIPVIVFYLLFLMHALGAGDVKLFSVIGVFLNMSGLCRCVFLAFLFGAGISLFRMVKEKSLRQRMKSLMDYAKRTVHTGQVTSYRSSRNAADTICFSVPILMGYLCYLLEVMC